MRCSPLRISQHNRPEPFNSGRLQSEMNHQDKTHLRPQRQKYNEKPKPFVLLLSPEWGRNIQALPKALELMFETGQNVTISNGVITVDGKEEN
jgi:hypothetical protein